MTRVEVLSQQVFVPTYFPVLKGARHIRCSKTALYADKFLFQTPEGSVPYIIEAKEVWLSEEVDGALAAFEMEYYDIEAALPGGRIIQISPMHEVGVGEPFTPEMFVLSLYIKRKPYQAVCRLFGPPFGKRISVVSLNLVEKESSVAYSGLPTPDEWRYTARPNEGDMAELQVSIPISRTFEDGGHRVSFHRGLFASHSAQVSSSLRRWGALDMQNAVEDWPTVTINPDIEYQGYKKARVHVYGSIHDFPARITIYVNPFGGRATLSEVRLFQTAVPSREGLASRSGGSVLIIFPNEMINWTSALKLSYQDVMQIIRTGTIFRTEPTTAGGDYQVRIVLPIKGDKIAIRLKVETERMHAYIISIEKEF